MAGERLRWNEGHGKRGREGGEEERRHHRSYAPYTRRASRMYALIVFVVLGFLEQTFGYNFPYGTLRSRRHARVMELRMDRRDDEIQRLKRENEELRRNMQKGQAPDPLGAIQAIFKPLANIIKPPKKQNELENMIDKAMQDAPLPIKMFGGIMKGFAGMAGDMMQAVADDVDRVVEVAERRVRMNAGATRILGSEISVGAPVSQSFSSSSINGVSTKQIALRLPVRGTSSSGTLIVDGSINSSGSISLKRCLVQTPTGSLDVGADGDDDDLGVIDVVAK